MKASWKGGSGLSEAEEQERSIKTGGRKRAGGRGWRQEADSGDNRCLVLTPRSEVPRHQQEARCQELHRALQLHQLGECGVFFHLA